MKKLLPASACVLLIALRLIVRLSRPVPPATGRLRGA
jgi:hypothetical protein